MELIFEADEATIIGTHRSMLQVTVKADLNALAAKLDLASACTTWTLSTSPTTSAARIRWKPSARTTSASGCWRTATPTTPWSTSARRRSTNSSRTAATTEIRLSNHLSSRELSIYDRHRVDASDTPTSTGKQRPANQGQMVGIGNGPCQVLSLEWHRTPRKRMLRNVGGS